MHSSTAIQLPPSDNILPYKKKLFLMLKSVSALCVYAFKADQFAFGQQINGLTHGRG